MKSEDKAASTAKVIRDRAELVKLIGAHRTLGDRIVLTSGTFDLFHIGHAKYLEAAKKHGDVLLVGVDSDKKVKKRKGNSRPIVPEAERISIVSYIQPVDYITVKAHDEERWGLIRAVRPDTLIVVDSTYDADTLKQLGELCGAVVVLPRQAQTSTSAKIRKIQISQSVEIAERLSHILDDVDMPDDIRQKVKEHVNGNIKK